MLSNYFNARHIVLLITILDYYNILLFTGRIMCVGINGQTRQMEIKQITLVTHRLAGTVGINNTVLYDYTFMYIILCLL